MTTDAHAASVNWSRATTSPTASSVLNVQGQSSVERGRLASTTTSVYALVPVAATSSATLAMFRAVVPVYGVIPTWEAVTAPTTGCNLQCIYYDLALDANPRNSQDIVVAGVSGVVRSTDGGSNWSQVGEFHSDITAQFDPRVPGVLWDGSDGGSRSCLRAVAPGTQPITD